MGHLMNKGNVSIEDFVAAGSALPYASIVIVIEPIFTSINTILGQAAQLNQMNPQILAPIAAELSFLNVLSQMQKDNFAALFVQHVEPKDSQEAYLRAIYQLPARWSRVRAHIMKLYEQQQGE